MKRYGYLLGLLLVVAGVAAIALKPSRVPDVPEGNDTRQWFKGNTHTHSLWSDGNDFPEMIVAWYQQQNYDFLALSDHNVLSRGERWMPVAQVEQRRKVGGTGTMAKYREAFGEAWVDTRGEAGMEEVRLKTLAERDEI